VERGEILVRTHHRREASSGRNPLLIEKYCDEEYLLIVIPLLRGSLQYEIQFPPLLKGNDIGWHQSTLSKAQYRPEHTSSFLESHYKDSGSGIDHSGSQNLNGSSNFTGKNGRPRKSDLLFNEEVLIESSDKTCIFFCSV